MSEERIETPVIETERLHLRPLRPEDAASYTKHFVDWDVIQYLSAAVPWPYPDDGVEWYFENQVFPDQGTSRWDWGVTLRGAESEVIGSIGLWRPGTPENRGFWLSKEHWGKGLMTEAASAVMDASFDVLGFERLVFANAVGNPRSRRVKEKTGARFIGVEPASFVREDLTEHELWELEASEWRARRETS